MNLGENTVLRAVVVAACTWEAAAILTNGPTWTKAIHWLHRRGPAGPVALGVVWGALSYHFFVEPLLREK